MNAQRYFESGLESSAENKVETWRSRSSFITMDFRNSMNTDLKVDRIQAFLALNTQKLDMHVCMAEVSCH